MVSGDVVGQLADVVRDVDVVRDIAWDVAWDVVTVPVPGAGMTVITAGPVALVVPGGGRRRCEVHPSIVADGRPICRVV